MTAHLHCYVYIDAPFDATTRLIVDDAAAVLQIATDGAAQQARPLSRRLRVNVGGFEVSKRVTIEPGQLEPRGMARSVLPLRWHASDLGLLFPVMTAELEVAAISLDPPLTQLTLTGTYDPPLGAIGAGADRLGLARLAEATVYRFLNEIASQVQHLVDDLDDNERI